MEHARQSRPDSGLGFEAKDRKMITLSPLQQECPLYSDFVFLALVVDAAHLFLPEEAAGRRRADMAARHLQCLQERESLLNV